MSLRRVRSLILSGVVLVIAGASCVSPSAPVSEGDQPALPASSTVSAVPWATGMPPEPVPEGDRPALPASPAVSVVPLATWTPQALAPSPTAAEPSDGAQAQNDRPPTRIVIPAIGLDAPVEPVGLHVETQDGQSANVWDVPNHFAAGWLKTSAPLGAAGNTVLDGHHNIYGKVFKDLINVQVGDTITLYAAGQERTYRVDQKLILAEAGKPLEIRQANAQYIAPTIDERLTLVTCWPPTGNSHRLIIVALPVASSPGLPLS